MRRKIWKIKELDSRVKSLAGELKLSPFLVQVLLNRGVAEEDFTSFLNPAPEFLHSPYLLPDINKAAQRVRKAIKGKEKVLVFGDYDVDGITSLAIFHEFAKDFPGTFSFYIPHRIEEGYGLNTAAIVKAKEDGVGLIIAFDCGTNAQPEISTARSLNIDIIVIDHHHPKDNLNPGFALVNPKLKSSKYPFSDLSAGALSFKFLQVLTGSDCHPVLDLVALSLVCDVTPLVGENRSLLHEGLKVIRKSRRPALRALCQATRIKQEYIDTFHIGYILGPRINASGRVAHAEDSLQLFLASDDKTAFDLALKLGEYNQLRKNIELQILREVEERIREDIAGVGAIVVSHNDWHPGVLGIVASRLKEKYYKPSFVISFDRDIGRGSGRSIAGVHLIEMLDKCADSLLVYGGHSRAAGVEIRKDELDNFKDKINSFVAENINPEDFIPAVDIDCALSFTDIDLKLVEDLEKIKPYGEGNPKPLFAAFNVFKKGVPKKVSSFFSLWLSDGTKTFEGIVYDKDILEIMNYAQHFDLVFSLQKNTYHNIPKLVISDCRLTDGND